MPEYLTPGVYFRFQEQPPPILGLRTDIAGFVGLARRGPLNTPVPLYSWRQFTEVFGDFLPCSYLAYAVQGFFANGGVTCYVVRVAGKTAARAALTLKNQAGRPVMEILAKNEGAWGNQIALSFQTRPRAGEFSLQVSLPGLGVERFSRLSLDPAAPWYAVINEGNGQTPASQWIEAKVPEGGPAPDLPDAGQSGVGKNGLVNLAGGLDGHAALTMDDLLGDFDPLASSRRGLSALDAVEAVRIVAMPDMHLQPVVAPLAPPPWSEPLRDPCLPCQPPVAPASPPPPEAAEQPPGFSTAEVLEIQAAMVEHCEQRRDRVAVLDAPCPGGRPLTAAEIQAWRERFDSPRGFAALYYPWIKVDDPLRLGANPLRAVPGCGHVTGIYARVDLSTGVHGAPANLELVGAQDVMALINDEVQGVWNPQGVNCLRAFPGRGLRVYGARTVSSDADWRYVNVRRLMLMIEDALDKSTQWAVFEPHDYALRQTLVQSVSSFLDAIWRRGALVGETSAQAYYVKCDDTNNPPSEVDKGKILVEIGVAPVHPAEFIVVNIERTATGLEITER